MASPPCGYNTTQYSDCGLRIARDITRERDFVRGVENKLLGQRDISGTYRATPSTQLCRAPSCDLNVVELVLVMLVTLRRLKKKITFANKSPLPKSAPHPSSDFGRIGSGSAWLPSVFGGPGAVSIASYRSGDPLVFSAALWPVSVLGFHTNKP